MKNTEKYFHGTKGEIMNETISMLKGRIVGFVKEMDKRVLARAMVNEVNDMTRQAGKPVLLI